MDALKIFNSTLEDFLQNLKKCDETLEYEKIEENDTIPLQKFLTNISNIETQISSKDETIFNQVITIQGVDVSKIYKNISKNENKEAIWKYIQTLLLIGKTIKSKSKTFEEFLEKDTDQMNNMMDMLKNMMGGMGGLGLDENDDNDDSGEEEDLIKMLETSKIGNLAKDISKEIDVSAFENIKLDNPDINSIMASLSKNDSIKSLIGNVTNVLKEKMESGELDQEAMKEEAVTFMNKMKNNKKIKKMLKSQNMQGLMMEMLKDKGIDTSDEDFSSLENMFKKKPPLPPSSDFNPLRGGGRRNAVRKRLKKKIEDKTED